MDGTQVGQNFYTISFSGITLEEMIEVVDQTVISASFRFEPNGFIFAREQTIAQSVDLPILPKKTLEEPPAGDPQNPEASEPEPPAEPLYDLCLNNDGRGWGNIFDCGDGNTCAKDEIPLPGDAQNQSICRCADANACGVAQCVANGGRGFGDPFACSDQVCSKNDIPSAGDPKLESICICPNSALCGS